MMDRLRRNLVKEVDQIAKNRYSAGGNECKGSISTTTINSNQVSLCWVAGRWDFVKFAVIGIRREETRPS